LTTGTPHQALYRRWRAQTFSQIVGQEAVVTTLRNAVLTGQVSHALLFTGPRGTGKTSLARIVAKAVNCLDLQPGADPCDRCPACRAIREGTTLDVIEIDAASNRGIDNIRELRERINYPPGELRRKVYILDEAHQITKDAWNALLKSLEEPPDFVLFMFASTHPQGFPPAILSRLQRYDVRRLTVPEITGKLQRILEADGRQADPDAVAVIAGLAAGGMRDAESILDQLLASTTERITADAVRELLGLADGELVDAFTTALATGDAASGVAALDGLEERGRDLRTFLDQAVDALRARLLADLASGSGIDPGVAAAARRLASIDPTRLGPGGLRLQLELALLEAAPSGPRLSRPQPAAAQTVTPATTSAAPAPAPDAVPPAPAPTLQQAPEQEAAPAAAPDSSRASVQVPGSPTAPAATPEVAIPGRPDDDLERLRRGWASVVSAIAARSPAAKAAIVDCRPVGIEGRIVTIGFPEEKVFLKDATERRRPLLETCIGEFLGHDVGVRLVATNLELVPPLPDDQEAADILAKAHEIFADDRLDVPEVS
jgi:DNA polymerase-3 subunit gamma/tau